MEDNERFKELVRSIEEVYPKNMKKEYGESYKKLIRIYVKEALQEDSNIEKEYLIRRFFDEIEEMGVIAANNKLYNTMRSKVIYHEEINKDIRLTIYKSEKGNYFETIIDTRTGNINKINDVKKWKVIKYLEKRNEIGKLAHLFPEEFMKRERV